jgi:2-polyprenyl-3-methyl-5-hydroxy-6-metoxy-1,4-benzoquinol methylase
MRFLVPLDYYQQRISAEVLQSTHAPFMVTDSSAFRAKVRCLWAEYQSKRQEQAPLWCRPFHQVDRLIFERKREEYIDDCKLPEERRLRLISGLDRLNRLVGTYTWFFRALRSTLNKLPPGDLTVLDIGSGHGSLPILLAKQSFPLHRLRVIGSDIEPAYVKKAQQNALEQSSPAEFRILDALSLDKLPEKFDIIICTQTVHHFSPEFVAELLYRAQKNARYAILFFDARRAALQLWGASLGNFLVNADWMLSHDGFVSIRRMYSPAELVMLAQASGLSGFQANNFGPFHVSLEWVRASIPEA